MSRIRLERSGGVGRITLARPEKKNALDRIAADELLSALSDLGADPSVRVVLIAADGDDFCAGADLESLERMLDAGSEVHRDDAEALGNVFLTIRKLNKPVVAAVRGRALAGGAGLATACDLVIAHEDARFGYPEVRVGFVPAMVMTMLRRAVGEKQAFDLVATGRMISARYAAGIGLVSRVVDAASFASEVESELENLANTSPEALRRTKQLFYQLDALDFGEGMARGADANVEARMTEDFREGVRRFVKRQRKEP